MKPTLSITTNREGARIHRLIDDTHYPTRNRKPEIRRDPMVEALFGAAASSNHSGASTPTCPAAYTPTPNRPAT